MRNLTYEAEQRDAPVTVLKPHVSTRCEMGHVVLMVLGMVVQMERRFAWKRQGEGIERAKVLDSTGTARAASITTASAQLLLRGQVRQ